MILVFNGARRQRYYGKILFSKEHGRFVFLDKDGIWRADVNPVTGNLMPESEWEILAEDVEIKGRPKAICETYRLVISIPFIYQKLINEATEGHPSRLFVKLLEEKWPNVASAIE